ncbi:Uncharacterised protein [Mycobacterium tuberculosis]|nr:Uncharacterised protein [Mycobacterium tuberculosis]COW00067.1 Uncharacterised protein [Mycobacterium tuberculosis]
MVLPDVPVIPITVNRSDGCPYTVAAKPPSTPRGAGCTNTGTAARPAISATPAGSVSTATAPRAIASPTWRAPWGVEPVRAANRSPGDTSWARSVTPVTVRSSVTAR